MTATVLTPQRGTLADTIPGDWVRDVALVTGFALLTAIAAQLSMNVWFTPVPITGQTFAVLLAGGTLGATRGLASQMLYVALGATGLPFYAEGEGGWSVATGSTAGYLVGFIVAAYVVGLMAERRLDRRVPTAIPAFLVGTVIIYGLGVLWLQQDLDVPFFGQESAYAYGVEPFLIADIAKAALAGMLLPAGWRVRSMIEGDRNEHGRDEH